MTVTRPAGGGTLVEVGYPSLGRNRALARGRYREAMIRRTAIVVAWGAAGVALARAVVGAFALAGTTLTEPATIRVSAPALTLPFCLSRDRRGGSRELVLPIRQPHEHGYRGPIGSRPSNGLGDRYVHRRG